MAEAIPLAPVILITPGDPAGIGPEVTVKALKDPGVVSICRPVVVGDLWVIQNVARRLSIDTQIHPLKGSIPPTIESGRVYAMDVQTEGIRNLVPGKPQSLGATSALTSIRRAVDLALQGRAEGIATGPINKEALRLGGYPWIGHTEMLQNWTHSPKATTLFITGSLRIFFATRHVSLREAIGLLKHPLIRETIVGAHLQMKRLGFSQPKLAVAGLNPHAGDGGLFGREEIDEIEPAVIEAREEGIDVEGPVSADSVFHQCIEGIYDAVIALVHDQGHIAAKTLDFRRTVSVTVGLPFVRTSVDHGTAFDIAWQGKADPTNLREAVRVAVDLVQKAPRCQGNPPTSPV